METITKKLQGAEVKRRCVCIPKDRQHLFPKPGAKLAVKDEQTGSVHEVVVGSQCRIRMPSWYDEHNGIQPGDTLVLRLDKGGMNATIVTKETTNPARIFERRNGKLSIFEGKVLDLVIDAFAGIEDRGIPAIVHVGQNGISVKWGPHIKETEIILGSAKVSV